MAIRVQLPSSKKPPAKVDRTFSGDRAAALARLAKTGPASDIPKLEPLSRSPPSPELPPEAPVPPVATRIRVRPKAAISAAQNVSPENAVPVKPSHAPDIADGGTPPSAGEISVAAAVDAEALGPGGTAPAAAGAAPDTVSEALLDPSSAPAMIRASGLLLKWGVLAAVLLAIGFIAMRFLVPFLNELRQPGKTNAIADKNAPTAVRVIQQTRAVVAKNDAKVTYLNEIVSAAEQKPVVTPPPVLPPEARPAAPVVVGSDAYLAPYQEAVARFTLGGVFDGSPPVVYLNGRIVKYAEIIDRNLGLRFIGVDVENKAVLFTNADNVTFRKYY